MDRLSYYGAAQQLRGTGVLPAALLGVARVRCEGARRHLRRAVPHDLFHRTHASDHFARRKFVRILAAACHSHWDVGLAVRLLRIAIPNQDRVTSACLDWVAHASRVLVIASTRSRTF